MKLLLRHKDYNDFERQNRFLYDRDPTSTVDLSAGNIRIKKLLDELSDRLDVPYFTSQTDPTLTQAGSNMSVYCVTNSLGWQDKLTNRILYRRMHGNVGKAGSEFPKPSVVDEGILADPPMPIVLISDLCYNPHVSGQNQYLNALVDKVKFLIPPQAFPEVHNAVTNYFCSILPQLINERNNAESRKQLVRLQRDS